MSLIISAFVAVIVGFGGSVAIVLAAAGAVGATPEQTSSWIAVLCLSMMMTSGFLSIFHRKPIVTAWSTPGAALIAATTGFTMAEATGAFLFAAALILLTSTIKPLLAVIERIPRSIASAMLAGVLFAFVAAIFDHLQATPALVLPLLALFLIIRLVSPTWAVLAVLVAGTTLAVALDLVAPIQGFQLSSIVFVKPAFDITALLGVGLPLFLVTMASQNLPGFAVLSSSGYTVPTRSILATTGTASLVSAVFGAHTTSLAAITASICTGPQAHSDKEKRWLCGPPYALFYGVLAVLGASIVAVFDSFPAALIATVAGVALFGPFVGALSAAVAEPSEQFAAAVTFAVTASGFAAFGIGAPFWGLVAGLTVFALGAFRASIGKQMPKSGTP